MNRRISTLYRRRRSATAARKRRPRRPVMAEGREPALRILAQPENPFRERYVCERGPHRNQRFQHAERNSGYTYPTLAISPSYQQMATHLCVTLVTVPQDETMPTFIHPFPLSNDDPTVGRIEEWNSLFFPITEEEFRSGKKELHIAQHRLTLELLRNYGPLRPFGPSQTSNPFSQITDPKQMVQTFQLTHSRLFFCFAKYLGDVPSTILFHGSGIYSQVRVGTTKQSKTNAVNCDFAPERGNYEGGDKVLMTTNSVDRRRETVLQFAPEFIDPSPSIPHHFINKNTLRFVTPRCPVEFPEGVQEINAPLIMMHNGSEIARINFIYQKMSTCPNCGSPWLPTETLDEENDSPDQQNLFDLHAPHSSSALFTQAEHETSLHDLPHEEIDDLLDS